MPRSRRRPLPHGLQPCPRLRDGIFIDSRGEEHDLARQTPITAKEAAGTHGLPDNPRKVLDLVRTGQLYPVLRLNARVIRIYPAALTDYWQRLTATA